MSTAELRSFTTYGILGGIDYRLDISNTASIVVGPNGTGKSTFLSLFYLLLSRQWTRLLEFDFDRLVLATDRGEISVTKADVLSLEAIPKGPGRTREYISRIAAAGQLDLFLKPTLNRLDREAISKSLSISPAEIQYFKRWYMDRDGPSTVNALAADSQLQNLDLGRILYMPTYRRIEKDIKSIFPDIESRFRDRLQESQITAREGVSFQEIVSFGMEDIYKIIRVATDSVKEFQRISTETASQEYIRDIVKGAVKNYSLKGIRELDEDSVKEFVDRLDVNLFTERDRKTLIAQIDELRRRQRGQPNKDMRYLAFFVEKLLAAHRRVKSQEAPLINFVRHVASYLGRNKRVVYENMEFSIRDAVSDKEISLDALSSGEKQIVSVFAYLLLKRENNYIVFIDEPELSLSVPWQKKFLPDILETGNCNFLFSVTHSPFVFDNSLRPNVIDVSRLRTETHGG